MNTTPRPARERETRLLVTTLVIAAGMLLLLSRFRFPEKPAPADAPPAATPAPLERLAARATYGELASILGGVDGQLARFIVPVRFGAGDGDEGRRDVPAIRIAAERAIALIDGGVEAPGVAASPDVHGLLAVDEGRGVALLKVSALRAETWREADTTEPVAAPGYAASVEVTPHGRAVRPFYFGRVDRESDLRWGRSLLRFSGLQQVPPPGAAIFLLDGRFVGVGTPVNGAFVVVPAALLREAAVRLESTGSIYLPDLGLEIAPLREDLQLALGADRGVVVTHVVATGPSHRSLRAGDVIERIAGHEIRTVPQYTAALAQVASGEPATLSVRRRGTSIEVAIVPAARGRIVAETSRQLGLDLRVLAGVGVEVVRVLPQSAGAIGGVLAGDVITALDDDEVPTPAAIQRAFDRAADGARLVLAVQRARDHHLLVLHKL